MRAADAQEIVRAISVLRGIPAAELDALHAQRIDCDEGHTLFEQGSPGDAVYGIVTGRLRIVKHAGQDKEFCLEVLGAGDAVAAVAVIRRVPMPASAVAMERTAAIRIPGDAFRQLMERHPSVSQRMLDLISRRLLDAGNSRAELATQPVEARVAKALLRLAEKFSERRGEEWIFSQNLTRQNLADLAGTTVESTIRVMSRWTKLGYVKSNASRITVCQRAELERIASSIPAE